MSYSFLIFDFGSNEDVAQQARHKIEGWKQGFRLDKKLQVEFDRKDAGRAQTAASEPSEKMTEASKPKSKSKPKSNEGDGAEGSKKSSAEGTTSDVRLIVRLGFSDHEKLSHQRWLDRIPTEEPFKSTKSKIVKSGDADFGETAELFESLGKHSPAWAKE